jgi:hypothetical protein
MLPKLRPVQSGRSTVDVFSGYNHNNRIGDGEWWDMKNMSSALYPLASPRHQRGTKVEANINIQGIVVNGGLCYLDGSGFVLPNGDFRDLELLSGKKTLVTMGAYVIILPDKKWINVAKCMEEGDHDTSEEYGDIEAEFSGSVDVTPCLANGDIDTSFIAAEKPTGPDDWQPEDGTRYADRSVWPPVVKKWYSEASMWVEEKTYIRISCDEVDPWANVSKGDTITAKPVNSNTGTIAVYIPENPTILDKKDGYVVTEGFCTRDTNTEYSYTRKMPDMDFIIESGNRLWGCKYGNTENGFINEIYASKLGDFKNWHSFQGVSTDSYAATIGAGGAFTGAVNYGGRPYFFKADHMIEVMGSFPAEYRVQTTPCRGVQEGCERSLAVVGNVLLYKTSGGVCVFDGSLPSVISAAFGEKDYAEAVAGGVNDKYYITMKDSEGAHLFVYDARKGLWHKEDDFYAEAFAAYGTELYAVSGNRIVTMLGSGTKDDTPVEWMLQSGEIGLAMPDAKYVTRLTVRMSMSENSCVSVWVRYDYEDEWLHIYTTPGTILRSFDIPIRPKRCDHMSIRIEGVGAAKIYSITKTIEQGSDRF